MEDGNDREKCFHLPVVLELEGSKEELSPPGFLEHPAPHDQNRPDEIPPQDPCPQEVSSHRRLFLKTRPARLFGRQ